MAGGPGARIVDRVGVQVVPDTSGFVADLKRELERLKHTMRVQLPTSLDLDGITRDLEAVKAAAEHLRVKIPVEYDEPATGPHTRQPDPVKVPVELQDDAFLAKAKADVERAQRELQLSVPVTAEGEALRREVAAKVAELQAQIRSMAVKIPVSTEQDAAKIRAELATSVAELQGLARANRVEIPLKAEPSEFFLQAERDVKALANALELKIPLTAKGERLRADVQARVRELQAQIRAESLKVPVDPEVAAKQKAELRAKIAELQYIASANGVKVPVTVDDKSASSGIGSIKSALGGLGSVTAGVTRGGLFAGIGIEAAAAVPQILTLAQSLAQVSAAALVIPAAGGAASGAIAALALGLHGFKDALSSMGDAKKFGEALKELSPNAREAASAIKESLPAWKEMQQNVQNVLFDKFAESVKLVTRDALPDLDTGLTRNAEAMSGLVAEFAKGIAQAGRLKQFSAIFENGAESLANLRKAVIPVIDGIMTLGVAGSKYLPQLTQGAEKAAKAFQEWADVHVSNGDFDRWVEKAKSNLAQIVDIGKSVIGIVKGIMDAAKASGADGLSLIQGALYGISQAVNTPAFQKGLTGFFDGISQGAANIGRALPDVAKAIGTIGENAGKAAPSVGAALGSALSLVADAAQAAAPHLSTIVSALADGLGPALQDVAPYIAEFVDKLGAGLEPVAQSLGQTVLPAVADALQKILPPLGDALVPLGDIIGKLLEFTVNSGLLGGAADALATSLQVLADALTVIDDILSGDFPKAMDDAKGSIGDLLEMFAALSATPSSLFLNSDAGKSFDENVAAPIRKGLSDLIANFGEFGPLVLGTLAGGLGGIPGMIEGFLTQAATIVQQWTWNVVSTIGQGMGLSQAEIQQAMTIIVSTVTGGMTGFFTQVFVGIARAVAEFTSGGSRMSGAVQQAMNLVLAFAVGGMAGFVSSIITGVTQAAAGMAGGVSQLISIAGSIPGQVVAALGDLSGILYASGQSLVGGLISGLQSMFGPLAAAAGAIAGIIKDHLPGSPVKRGPLVSWNNGGAGKRLAALLIEGLDASNTDITDAAARMASAVATGTASMPVSFTFEQTPGTNQGTSVNVTMTGDVWGSPDDFIRAQQTRLMDALVVSRLGEGLA